MRKIDRHWYLQLVDIHVAVFSYRQLALDSLQRSIGRLGQSCRTMTPKITDFFIFVFLFLDRKLSKINRLLLPSITSYECDIFSKLTKKHVYSHIRLNQLCPCIISVCDGIHFHLIYSFTFSDSAFRQQQRPNQLCEQMLSIAVCVFVSRIFIYEWHTQRCDRSKYTSQFVLRE